jgi:chaperonin GroES
MRFDMKKMNVQPLHDKVLVAENARKELSNSGLFLGEDTSETRTGTVLAVGPEVTEVKVKDVILLDWGKGTIVSIDDVQRVMIKEEHIIAVIEK